MTDQLPADIAEAIVSLTMAHENAVKDAGLWIRPQAEEMHAARAALDAVILKHLRPSSTSTFPCPKCGVRRGWLPACAQDGCPMLNMDGKPLGRSALAEEGGGR